MTALPVQDPPWHRCGQGQVCRVRQRHRHRVGLILFTSHTHLTALYNQAPKVREDPLGGRPRGKAEGQVPTEAQPWKRRDTGARGNGRRAATDPGVRVLGHRRQRNTRVPHIPPKPSVSSSSQATIQVITVPVGAAGSSHLAPSYRWPRGRVPRPWGSHLWQVSSLTLHCICRTRAHQPWALTRWLRPLSKQHPV